MALHKHLKPKIQHGAAMESRPERLKSESLVNIRGLRKLKGVVGLCKRYNFVILAISEF